MRSRRPCWVCRGYGERRESCANEPSRRKVVYGNDELRIRTICAECNAKRKQDLRDIADYELVQRVARGGGL